MKPVYEKRIPIFGVFCVVLMFAAVFLPFFIGLENAGRADIQLRYVLPFVGAALAIAAIIRQESAVWAILGLFLTLIYFGLHLIAFP